MNRGEVRRLERVAEALPVPRLPEHFSTSGWRLRKWTDLAQLIGERLFELRIDYDDGQRRACEVICLFDRHVDGSTEDAVVTVHLALKKAIEQVRDRLLILR